MSAFVSLRLRMGKAWLAGLLGLLAASCAAPVAPTASPLPPTPSEIPVMTATPVSAPAVQAWLTLPDRSKALSPESAIALETGSSPNTLVIHLDDSVRYQTIEGVGAAMTESSAWLLQNKLTTAQRDAVMRALFSREGTGIGLNYLRVPMGASDFALSDYTYDDVPGGARDLTLSHFSIDRDRAAVIPALLEAQALNPQLRLMGSPWSPPAWMKKHDKLHGGSLRPEYYGALAEYDVKFIQAYTAAGLTVDALTPQNEPQYATEGYPSMLMSPLEQQTFVRDYLGPALKAASLSTRVFVLDHNWDLSQYALDLLADPAAAEAVAGVAFHCYAGDVSAQSLVHQAHPDKSIWFTECSGGDWATDFGGNMSWNIHNLIIGNFRNWGQGVLMWNLALDEQAGPQNGGCSDCRGVVTIRQDTGAVTFNEEYYFLGHVSKFVDVGAQRIESTPYGEGLPENVAFRNPDGSLVLLVHATQASTFDVEWNGQHFTYRLPARGTVTFKWNQP